MVFEQNKVAFENEGSFQLSFQNTRELNCGELFVSSGDGHNHEKEDFPDGHRPGGNLELANAAAASGYSDCNLQKDSNFSCAMDNSCESTRMETSKRPFGDDENCQVAKRTRQMDGDFSPLGNTCDRPFFASKGTDDDDFKSGKDAAGSESADLLFGSNFSFPRFPYCTNEENSRLEPLVRLSFFPGYYEDHHWPAGYYREESQSPVYNYLPRKHVAIGPDHQVDIPVWRPKGFQYCHRGDGSDTSTSSGHTLADEDSSVKWIGHCIIPMPDATVLGLDGPHVRPEIDCCCLDEGSIRCVRQHVMEAREELKSSLGHECFLQLGFSTMGEDVALRWTEEEEDLFHEVVASNPASLGKNFWDDLPEAFPSKSSKELVSYYFNVFMLRKRAEQNRSDPLNVDSDNDEWQDSYEDEFGAREEDGEDDSGVESPADAAAQESGLIGGREVDIHEEAGEDVSENEEYGTSDEFLTDGKLKFRHDMQPKGVSIHESSGDQDVHDDSCTSYEGQHNGDHGNLHPEYRNDGVSGITGHDFVAGHGDPKPWEFGFFHGLDKELDFLPTCNVIEEVFGNESWDKPREGQGLR